MLFSSFSIRKSTCPQAPIKFSFEKCGAWALNWLLGRRYSPSADCGANSLTIVRQASPGSVFETQQSWQKMELLFVRKWHGFSIFGGFLKWWYPTTMGFPTKNDHFGVFWGNHYFRKHPFRMWLHKKIQQKNHEIPFLRPHVDLAHLWDKTKKQADYEIQKGELWTSTQRLQSFGRWILNDKDEDPQIFWNCWGSKQNRTEALNWSRKIPHNDSDHFQPHDCPTWRLSLRIFVLQGRMKPPGSWTYIVSSHSESVLGGALNHEKWCKNISHDFRNQLTLAISKHFMPHSNVPITPLKIDGWNMSSWRWTVQIIFLELFMGDGCMFQPGPSSRV